MLDSPRYLLDTNILVHAVRADETWERIKARYAPLMADPRPFISVVSEGELRSLIYQFNWGTDRVDQSLFLLSYFQRLSIDLPDMFHAYAVIDAASRRGGIKMGKNDLWIAAATHVSGATLLTTDQDFDHLNGTFLAREWIAPTW